MGNTTTPEIRRDSNSTVSTYYGSMKSSDLESSRRSSQVIIYIIHEMLAVLLNSN
jgi:hypothetical protein